MRNMNLNILSALDNLTSQSSAIDANQLISASLQAYFGDTNAAGTFKIQGSNDVTPLGYNAQPSGFIPTNWADIPNTAPNVTTATIASGASAILTIPQMTFRWIRAVYTNTAAGVQTIAPIADTGVKQIQRVVPVDDVSGSLNSTYFLVYSVNLITKVQKNFYVWLDNGSGIDPLVPFYTAVHIVYSNNATAATLAGLINTALNALTNDFSSSILSSTNVNIANLAYGPVTHISDGGAPTGFFFQNIATGVVSNLTGEYFFLNSAGNPAATVYYVWFNVDGISTDPAPAGKTAIPVAISSGSSAGTIGTAMATAIAAANSSADFTAAGTTTVTVTNKVAGPWIAASDFNSGFTFAKTGGGTSTINVTLNALSV